MENLLTTPEAGEVLKIKKSTLCVWRCQGRGPRFVKICGAIRYRRQDLETYINNNTVEAGTATEVMS
jgi:predicted DNA-binding transcriptional regulator AlpA